MTDRTRAYGGGGPSSIPAGTFARPGGTVSTNLLFDGLDNTYRTNAGTYENLPGTTIAAVTKLYTVPAGYLAYVTFGATNTSAGTIVVSFFTMTDASTPLAADRVGRLSLTTGTSGSIGNDTVIDEGGTLWAFSDTATGLNATPFIQLFPKPLPGGTYTPVIVKGVPLTDTTLYTVSTAGNWAQGITAGTLHNTTGTAITVTTKVKRAADPTAVVAQIASVAANASAAYNLNSIGALLNGDLVSVIASAAGVNLNTLIRERPLVGYP
jgi:hypothetical protein